MSNLEKDCWGEECSVAGEKREIGFIDFQDYQSVLSSDPSEGLVILSAPFPFVQGKPQSILVGETSKCSITIQNTTREPVELWGIKIYSSNPAKSFTLSLMEPPSGSSDTQNNEGFVEGFSIEDRVLQPLRTLTIWLSCKPKEMGLHTSVVHFDIGDDRFERVVFLLAEDSVSQSLASNRPYSKLPRKMQSAVDEYAASSGPARTTTTQSRPTKQGSKCKLPEFPIPKDIRESVANKILPEVLVEGLRRKNYFSFFSTLLAMEELRLEEDMRCHNMECVTMRRKGRQLVALDVPGLAERRPSLVHGDYVFVKLAAANADANKVHKGSIYQVEADEVILKFTKVFHTQHKNDSRYNVSFTYNRINMRRMYQAVQAAENLESILLFPSQSTKQRLTKGAPFVPFTSLNEEQMRSVEIILGRKGAPPYVIYGPPGTGKTKTLVEAILQVYSTRKDCRILVCAASNSAADHMLERLISHGVAEIKDNEIFRLNATSRPYEDVPTDFIRFCFSEESIFKCPPRQALERYRIIISTYMSSSLLILANGIKRGNFSHIFLDEAGQASEPESMIPIANLCTKQTVVVLAGDPKQLGPVIYSKDAETFGLGKSYLERLFECEFYHNQDEGYATKLVRNYRCHPAILDLPSKLFYGGELLACKDDATSLSSAKVDIFPNKDFPVLFFGIQGYDEREGHNPSWFNRFEVSKVVDIINKLRENTEINETDIGVITPYRQQVLKIKKVLETRDMPDVKVGSVEQFQGQEREVIIVSTVRSTIKHNEFDKTYCLGFLSNPRRFNVAITRARSLLIIVGNPHIVCQDHYWNKLLWHCCDNNSYQGCPAPERRDCADDPYSSNSGSWRQPFQAEDVTETPQPLADEAEWSDGWK